MSSSQSTQRRSMASRFTNSPVFTRLRNSPVISVAKRWAAGKASPKPQPKDPNPRRYLNNNSQKTTSKDTQDQTTSSNNEETNGTNPINNKITKFAKNASPRLKKMGEGFLEAVKGGYSSIRNEKIRENFFQFLKSVATITVALYAIAAILLFVYYPIVVFFYNWCPGIFGQFLTLIPLWSFIISRKRSPAFVNKLFLDQLETLSPQRAEELSQQMKLQEGINDTWMEEVYRDLRTSWHFTKYSLMFLAFSVIPVVGSFITYLGQMWLVADRMGWNLLSVYTISTKRMSYRQQKHWMRARKWRIIGFTLPYMFLASIPLIGPLFLGIAQAATADIYYHLLSKDTDSGEKKRTPSSPLVEFKKAN